MYLMAENEVSRDEVSKQLCKTIVQVPLKVFWLILSAVDSYYQ